MDGQGLPLNTLLGDVPGFEVNFYAPGTLQVDIHFLYY